MKILAADLKAFDSRCSVGSGLFGFFPFVCLFCGFCCCCYIIYQIPLAFAWHVVINFLYIPALLMPQLCVITLMKWQ